MNIISKLAIKDIRYNKKFTITIILSIIIVTLLVNSIITLSLSYKEYIVNLSRSKNNWESKFSNIEYKDIEFIKDDKDIKQYAIVDDLGITTNSFSDWFKYFLHIKSYDYKAIQNLNIPLKEGRLPRTSNEIIINKDMNIKIGEKINATINNNNISFEVVGLIESTEFDMFDYKNLTKVSGAITLLDINEIKIDELVDVYLLHNHISNTYECTRRIEKKLNSTSIIIDFNNELLSYACVAESGSEFQRKITMVVCLLLAIIFISSIALIYTIFNISVSEKKKYIASLSSIGATKQQIFKIYILQAIILSTIGIGIGLIINYGIDYFLINIFNKLFKTIQNNLIGTSLKSMIDVDLKLIYSPLSILLSILFVNIITFISILKPIINISKVTIIDLIRKNIYNKTTTNTIKSPKFILKTFGITGELAYKNIRRSHSKYISIMISLIISIILFISISGYVNNLNFYNEIKDTDYNYSISILKNTPEDIDYTDEIFNILNQFELIDSIYGTNNLNTMYIVIGEDKINNSLLLAANKVEQLHHKLYGNNNDSLIQLPAHIMILDDNTFEKYMQKLGKDISLRKDECILVNYSNAQTKFYNGFNLTNFKPGDKVILNTQDRYENLEIIKELNAAFNGENSTLDIENNKIELNIKYVTDIIPRGIRQDIYGSDVYLIVNNTTFSELFESTYGAKYNNMLNYYICSSDANKLDSIIETLNEKYDGLTRIFSMNYSLNQQSDKNEKTIKEILLYSFSIFIAVLAIINVFNIILSNIILRKFEFAELVSIGMSKKQLNKMLRIEGLLYGSISIIVGTIISLIILYLLYTKMIDTTVYAFSIPFLPILLSIIIIYAIIFTIITYAKHQLDITNISEIIKEK